MNRPRAWRRSAPCEGACGWRGIGQQAHHLTRRAVAVGDLLLKDFDRQSRFKQQQVALGRRPGDVEALQSQARRYLAAREQQPGKPEQVGSEAG